MALQKVSIKRVFVLTKDGKEIRLDDVNENLTPEEICDIYSNTYPELVNCNIEPGGIVNDERIFKFTTIAGTKG